MILCLGVSSCLLIYASKSSMGEKRRKEEYAWIPYTAVQSPVWFIMCFFFVCVLCKGEMKGEEKKMHGCCIQQTSHQFDVFSAHREQNLYSWHWTERHVVFVCLCSSQTWQCCSLYLHSTHPISQKVHSSIKVNMGLASGDLLQQHLHILVSLFHAHLHPC